MRDIDINEGYLIFKEGIIVAIIDKIDLESYVKSNKKYDFIIYGKLILEGSFAIGIEFLGVDFLYYKQNKTRVFSKDQLECLYLNRELIGRAYCRQEQPGEQNT